MGVLRTDYSARWLGTKGVSRVLAVATGAWIAALPPRCCGEATPRTAVSRSLVLAPDLLERIARAGSFPVGISSSECEAGPRLFATIPVGDYRGVVCGPYLAPSRTSAVVIRTNTSTEAEMLAAARIVERLAGACSPSDRTARLAAVRDPSMRKPLGVLFPERGAAHDGLLLWSRMGVHVTLAGKRRPRTHATFYFPRFPPVSPESRSRPVQSLPPARQTASLTQPSDRLPARREHAPAQALSVTSKQLREGARPLIDLLGACTWGPGQRPHIVDRTFAQRAVAFAPSRSAAPNAPLDAFEAACVALGLGEREVDDVVYVTTPPGTVQWWAAHDGEATTLAYQRMVAVSRAWVGDEWQRALESSLAVGPVPVSALPAGVAQRLTQKLYPRAAYSLPTSDGHPWYEGWYCLCTLRVEIGVESTHRTRVSVSPSSDVLAHSRPFTALPADVATRVLTHLGLAASPSGV